MAIIIDEGEKKTNLLGIAGWIVFLCVIGATVYYVFFAQPQLVAIPAMGTLQRIAPITQAAIQPDAVMQNPVFQTLKPGVTSPSPQGPAGVGRTNPFIAP